MEAVAAEVLIASTMRSAPVEVMARQAALAEITLEELDREPLLLLSEVEQVQSILAPGLVQLQVFHMIATVSALLGPMAEVTHTVAITTVIRVQR